jgi:hypothetical protein
VVNLSHDADLVEQVRVLLLFESWNFDCSLTADFCSGLPSESSVERRRS